MKNFLRQALSNAAHTPIVWSLGIAVVLSLVIIGCAQLAIVDDVVSAGKKVKDLTDATNSFQTNPSEQEYYIGRAVGATIAGRYNAYDNQEANDYVNLVGQTLAQASDRPETFGGYHFLILDSDEINAFAAPGGLIFVTRGMLRCARHEGALAAVLTHEIAHVQHQHGLQAIKKSRLSSVLTAIGIEVFSFLVDSDLVKLVEIFQDSITDITTTMVNKGYSRSSEREADRTAVTIMQRVGYDPNGLIEMLRVMEERLNPEGKDFVKTHPSPASRIADIQKIIGEYAEVKTPEVRQARFEAALGNI